MRNPSTVVRKRTRLSVVYFRRVTADCGRPVLTARRQSSILKREFFPTIHTQQTMSVEKT